MFNFQFYKTQGKIKEIYYQFEKNMNCKNEQGQDLYGVLALAKDVNELVFHSLIKIFRREKIQDCLDFLQQSLNQSHVKQEMLEVGSYSHLEKLQMLNVNMNDIKKIAIVLNTIKDHELNRENYSVEKYKQIKQNLITKISQDVKIQELFKFLVQLTSVDDNYIQCGSNSLHLLVEMKVDLREQSFENIRIRNTSLIRAKLVRCDLSGSEFDNVIIRGINLNGAKLFNCKWRNLGINEGILLNGHVGKINSVCFSRDSNYLASCSDDKTIRLWDMKTGYIKSVLKGKSQVNQACFSPNSTTLASCNDQFVYLWNLKTNRCINKLVGHNRQVNTICLFSDGTTLASGSSDKSIRLWDVKTRQQQTRLEGHNSAVWSVCFSLDGTTLASGSGEYKGNECSIRLWDVKTGLQKAKFDCQNDYVLSVCFSPDSTTLASGGDDNAIRLWDFKTGQQKAKLDGHSNTVYSICYSPDGTKLASGSSDNSIRLWDVKTGQQKAKFDGHTSYVYSVCCSIDGTTLASGSDDNSIRLWDVKTELQILPTNNLSNDKMLASIQPPIFPEMDLTENITPKLSIQQISQNPYLEASGALIMKGEFVNYQEIELLSLFKSKGSLILEGQTGQQYN
ncbi:unnamed protein product [Paramecium octaurelia]|uniref:WD-40 repeat protein n=1 Tax=Paramecium octaurelia TaxID=43137 RepID=A0A8S1UVK5_PAROT|nr:unnamed protein product [Paramecium octaurelia]